MKNNCKFVPKYTVKNSFEPINKIKYINTPTNAKFISFEVQNLFPSTPPKEDLLLVSNFLDKNVVNPEAEIVAALEIFLYQNYFQFNNILYIREDGLIMSKNSRLFLKTMLT